MPLLTELGLEARLADAAAAEGWTEATPLQAAAVPVLRRGGTVVLHASAGAGVTGAWLLPLLTRLAEESGGAGPRALVLEPSPDGVERAAAVAARLGASVGVRVRALADGWRQGGDAEVVVATPASALAAVGGSALKLESLSALVLADLDVIHRLGGTAGVEVVTPLVPRDAQRVITAAELTPAIEHYVEAHARKALTIPHRPADTRERVAPALTGSVNYAIVPDADRIDTLVRLLAARPGPGTLVATRGEAGADRLRATLALRGYPADDGWVRVVPAQGAPATGADISFDVPLDAELLRSLHRKGGVVLVLPREAAHLRRIAADAGLALQAAKLEASGGEAIADYRRQVRQAIHDEDVAAQLALLNPLFDEFSPAEVAAALSALLRRRQPPAPAARPSAAPPAEAAATFVRLFISLGTRDGIRPADLVGAITGEAGIKGEQVGKIEIRETFSVVEIGSAVAEKVIRALNGTTLRSRAVRVDYDRKSAGVAGERRSGARREASPGPRGRRPPPRGD